MVINLYLKFNYTTSVWLPINDHTQTQNLISLEPYLFYFSFFFLLWSVIFSIEIEYVAIVHSNIIIKVYMVVNFKIYRIS
jgi:hypothetical protein